MAKQFVHLHNHTDFSLLDGMQKVDALVAAAAKDGQPAVATTDHGNPAAAVQLAKAASKHGITAIPGLEAYHVPDVSKARDLAATDGKSRFHLTLLAVNDEGYRNIMRLSSEAALDNFYYQPLVDDEMLARYSEGIVATSSCLGSQFNQLLLRGDRKEAMDVLARHRDIFGPDRYFIEVQDHGIPDQKLITPDHLALSREMGIPLLATNDTHYIHKEDAQHHDFLLCMQTGSLVDDEDRFRFSSDENYLRSTEEMYRLFPEDEFPDACKNTLVVAEMAKDLHIPIGDEYLIPQYPGAEGNEAKVLREKTLLGAVERYGDSGRIPERVSEQVDFELGVIHDMGFDAYFLLVADIVQWAKSQGIAVGPGRGSAAGSIVSYCLSITNVDPLKYGLYFERFMNPGRRSMPDIDIDFEPSERWRVRQYAADRFGHDRVAYIATYGEMKPKAAIKGVGRTLGRTPSRQQQLSNLVPGATASGQITLREILGKKSDVRDGYHESWEQGEHLRNEVEKHQDAREVLDVAKHVEGYFQQRGVHAAAILITPGPLTDYVPLHRPKDEGDLPVCAYDKDDAEAIGGLKMDFLGLINLSVIKEAVQLIKEDLGITVDIDNIPLDDPKVFDLLSRGDTEGVFQLEGEGITKLLVRMKPDRFEDISAVLALYRPGPMGSDMHTKYADRKNGREKVTAPHEDFKTMFADTFAEVIYQEQLIRLVQHYAGFTPAEADTLRKATGKKDAAMIAGQEQKFKRGMISQGYSQDLADEIWRLIPPFASYSFNKAHSVAYAFVTYQTAWLKANYPAQFVAACIDNFGKDRIPLQIQFAKNQGLEVHLPNVNRSGHGARTSRDSIWLGLSGIARTGSSVVDAIVRERNSGGEFSSMADFLVRMAPHGILNKASLQNMIMAGVFDTLHSSRKLMLEEIEPMLADAKVESAFEDDDDEDDLFADMSDSVSKAIDSYVLDGEDYPLHERITMEIEALGFFAGLHPFSMVKRRLKEARQSGAIPQDAVPVGSDSLREGRKAVVYGTLSSVEYKTTRGRTRSIFHLETDSGETMSVTVFREVRSDKARPGALVIASGGVRRDTFGRDDDEDAPLSMNGDKVEFVPLSMFSSGEEYGSGRTAKTFTFEAPASEEAMQSVAQAIMESGEGPDRLVIVYRGQKVFLPSTFDLDGRDDILTRVERMGATLVGVE